MSAVSSIELPLGAEPLAADYAGYRLTSAFQPIVSIAHRRVVGHEALLRASDAQGTPVGPMQVLALPADADAEIGLDALCLRQHLRNFEHQARGEQWLFVNLRPASFLRGLRRGGDNAVLATLRGCRLKPSQLVLEVTEDAVAGDDDFESSAQVARELGFLLALDDFGAGHSNFDRVWRIKPHIVKLDRSLVQHGAADAGVARVIAQMVSLLHQCGALVVMEGIETPDEAHLALDCDVDLVQGYLFGKPAPRLHSAERLSAPLVEAWSRFGQRSSASSSAQRERIGPYINAIGYGGGLIEAGRSLREACASFLELPGAELCYLLDEHGVQLGTNLLAGTARRAGPSSHYAPLRDAQQACWARRPYFRRAIEAPGKVQVTRPYLSVQGAHLCVTVSIALLHRGQRFVLCGDVAWS